MMQSNIIKYYLLSFFESFSAIYAVNIIFYQAVGLSFKDIGLLVAALAATTVVLEVPSGVFCDFFGRRITVAAGCVLGASGFFVIGASDGFRGMLVGSVLCGVAEALCSGAEDALLYDSLKLVGRESQFLRIQSHLVLLNAISMISACILGSYLFVVDQRLPWMAVDAANLVACLCVLPMKEPHSLAERYSLANQARHLRDSVSSCWQNRAARWLIVFSTLATLPVVLFMELGDQPYLIEIGFDPAELGYVFAVALAVSSVAASFSYRIEDRMGEARPSFSRIKIGRVAWILLQSLVRKPGEDGRSGQSFRLLPSGVTETAVADTAVHESCGVDQRSNLRFSRLSGGSGRAF